MQPNLKHLLVLTGLVGVLIWVVLSVPAMIETRVVAGVDHPNGSRLRVVQKFKYSTDFFDTSIYFDDGDGRWRWYFYDHKDGYWGSAESAVEGAKIRITSNKRSIVIDTKTGDCTMSDVYGFRRTYTKSEWFRDLAEELEGEPYRMVSEQDMKIRTFSWCVVFVLILFVVGVAGYMYISDSNYRSALNATRNWARLSEFPASATQLTVETEGGLFSREFTVKFSAPLSDVERWLNESPGTKNVEPQTDGSFRKYLIEPGDGAAHAELEVDDRGHVQIYVRWS